MLCTAWHASLRSTTHAAHWALFHEDPGTCQHRVFMRCPPGAKPGGVLVSQARQPEPRAWAVLWTRSRQSGGWCRAPWGLTTSPPLRTLSAIPMQLSGSRCPSPLPIAKDTSSTRLLRPPAARTVQQLESREHFQQTLAGAGDKFAVADFSAMRCGPCRMIKPFLHSLSEKYSNTLSLEVDVDDCQDVAAEWEVKCMATFWFFKKGEKASELSGANKEKLEATISELT
ncbi:PREDICTED: thioredoxin domain-containing protein 2-like [Chinchilla lanigera]|uniref:thioredoxin domain-containing protein 2-like n=1 Tax=Chinchilla lanigera TaxID=34839 RepID=UPI00038EF64E|nr:PREDICTED: thioredoxin domain-containing protein 2-like [Chinchilla lanigera]